MTNEPLYPRHSELDDGADARIDELDDLLRAALAELRLTHERAFRLEAAFMQLRQDVDAACKRLEESYAR
jgi:hypothetical protein